MWPALRKVRPYPFQQQARNRLPAGNFELYGCSDAMNRSNKLRRRPYAAPLRLADMLSALGLWAPASAACWAALTVAARL